MRQEYVMGNGAIALGALCAGVNLAAGYPGTPSSEIIETLAKYTADRKNPGKKNGGEQDSPSAGECGGTLDANLSFVRPIHIEWSVNEKAALEVAASAAYSGARALVTMKQVGLNVAADALMSLAYVGVKGGMVIVAADDPGPISSQTEQDTRMFAVFARIPVFDPSSPEDAFTMIQDAFDYSEKYHTPVLLRPTTRICHAYASIRLPEPETGQEGNARTLFSPHPYEGFIKDSKKWVIFPRLSFANHAMIEKRNPQIGDDFSDYAANLTAGNTKKAVFASGVSYAYAKEFLQAFPEIKLCRIATPYPFPERLVLSFLEGVEEVLCIEELSPFVETELLRVIGAHGLSLKVYGKRTGHIAPSGENSADSVREVLQEFLGMTAHGEDFAAAKNAAWTGDFPSCAGKKDSVPVPDEKSQDTIAPPALPVRPPVLCAGCPHRASFYAVKKAMQGKRSYFCGDIGCYTLGNAMPLDMVDTCLCMGAGVTMAQGFHWLDADGVCFAFLGDSTFFASGMTGVVNALYNNADMVLCVLDNATTAMTGHQPHPGTGINMMGDVVNKVSIEAVLSGMGVKTILQVDPLDLDAAVAAVKECAALSGVRAIIFKSPCIAVSKPTGKMKVTEQCIGCGKCIREIGCPAIGIADDTEVSSCTEITSGTASPAGVKIPSAKSSTRQETKIRRVTVDTGLCTGCGLCSQICPAGALVSCAKTPSVLPAMSPDTQSLPQKTTPGTTTEARIQHPVTIPEIPATVPANLVLKGSAFKKDILICGVGGQGTVLASKLIASAAMQQNAAVHSAETIGMAQRGGSVTSHVRIGEHAYSPLIPAGSADLLLAFEPAEAVRNLRYLKQGGTVIVSRTPVKPASSALQQDGYDGREMIDYLKKICTVAGDSNPDCGAVKTDSTRYQCIVVDPEILCAPPLSPRYLNSAMLGVAVGSQKSGLSAETVLQEIAARVPERFVDANRRAFLAGLMFAVHGMQEKNRDA